MSKCIESLLLYGMSDSGKTTQVSELARWVHDTLGGKFLRLISSSGGGWTSIQDAVDLDLVKPFNIRARSNPFDTLYKVSKGYWPKDVLDPTSKLLKPDEQADWAGVGAIAFDSLTETAEWMQQVATKQEAEGKIRISAEPVVAKFRDGDEDFASPSRAGYGLIQNHLAMCVAQSKSIPDRYIMWTALQLMATDDNTRLPLYGPDIIGKAKTAIASSWFDDTLHLHLTSDPVKGKIRRLYLTTHYEADKIPYVAKNRSSWNSPLGKDFLEGPDLSLYKFFQMLEESKQKAAAVLKSKLKQGD